MQSPLSHHLTLALFAFGSSLDGYLHSYVTQPYHNAFWASHYLCSLALWFAREVGLCRIGYVFVLLALVCFCDKPSPPSVLLPSP